MKTKIEWADYSWNPIRALNKATGKKGHHCEHTTTGCEFCYAEGMNKRLGTGLPFKPGHRKDIEIFLDEEMLLAPLRWKKPRRIFVCSMTDLFADFVEDGWIDKVIAVAARCPHHKFQVLTKRAERMRGYFNRDPEDRLDDICHELPGALEETWHYPATWPLPNLCLGVSAERQQEADERIPLLRDTPAAVRFVSFEPLLGHIDPDLHGIHWAIVGGESGPQARPMHPDWARSLRDQCAAADVAFFFKQFGEWAPFFFRDDGLPKKRFTFDDGAIVYRVGKANAGRVLDNQEWSEFPEATK